MTMAPFGAKNGAWPDFERFVSTLDDEDCGTRCEPSLQCVNPGLSYVETYTASISYAN